jgi:hypothetical protein
MTEVQWRACAWRPSAGEADSSWTARWRSWQYAWLQAVGWWFRFDGFEIWLESEDGGRQQLPERSNNNTAARPRWEKR